MSQDLHSSEFPLEFTVFSIENLGWLACCRRQGLLRRLVFGMNSPAEALSRLDIQAEAAETSDPLEAPLRDLAQGRQPDFSSTKIDWEGFTEFQQQVYRACLAIPFGQTRSYAEIAAAAGSPRAARAVGNAMSANRVPLVIPCHRVVAAGEKLGGYSAEGGTRMKRFLLELES